ncbi:MAG: serine/threonine-protein kinase [Sandaracinaceae bacterium]
MGIEATPSRGSAAPGAGSTSPDRLPRRFGRYLLFDRIGRGGMADIYLSLESTDLGASRRVVVKQILAELSRRPTFAKMLIDEAKLVAGLRHQNIAQVTDLGREADRLFIAMEYVEGYDLNQLLRHLSKRKIPLPAEFGFFIVREILAGLDFAHRATAEDGTALGIVHRDVSPSNVLISFEGEVKLCDFGIAKAYGSEVRGEGSDESVREERDGTFERSKVIGKAAYMSPEQASGADITGAADQFVAGIILFELCAGRRLYKGTEEEMLALARRGEVPPLPERGMREHAVLAEIVARACARAPEDRWESCAAMAAALDDYAMRTKSFVSQIRFGTFLSEHFEAEVVRSRRERETAARALEQGPPVLLRPVGTDGPTTLDEDDRITEDRPEDGPLEAGVPSKSPEDRTEEHSLPATSASDPAAADVPTADDFGAGPAHEHVEPEPAPLRDVEADRTRRLAPMEPPPPASGVGIGWLLALGAIGFLMLGVIGAAIYVLLIE